MPDRPTLHLTNWSSGRLHGPGRAWTIMARPRDWEWGQGSVPMLVPDLDAFDALQAGTLEMVLYQFKLEMRWERGGVLLVPGALKAVMEGLTVDVADGDTLCCACSREDAAAARCHRAWAARSLKDAGWRVVLDGRDLDDPGDEADGNPFGV